jgi:hypothetical protein
VYNLERPRFFDCPRIDCLARSSSSVEVVDDELVDNSRYDRTNCDSDSILSSRDLRHNKTWEHYRNKPSRDHNTVNDTSGRHQKPFQKKMSTLASGAT